MTLDILRANDMSPVPSSSKTDLMYEISYNPKFVPRRSPKVNVKMMIIDDEKIYIMKNHVMGTYFSLSEFANDLWNLVDGNRSVAEIVEEIQYIWTDATPRYVRDALIFYADKDALKAVAEPARKKRVRVASAFEVYVAVVLKTKDFIGSIHRFIRPLLRGSMLWVTLAFILLCSGVFASRFVAVFADKSNFQILGSSVVGFFFYTFLVLMPVILVHEIAHGLALVHYGGEPREMGTGLFYFGPVFYIDTTDAWMLTRRQRIMVYLAGNISTLMIGAAIVVTIHFVQFPPFISHVLFMAAFYCFYMTLLNFSPPFETDGYYILSDLVKVPNLRQDAYNYLKTVVKKAFGKPVEESEALTRRKKKILLGYAVLSAAWIAYIAFQTSLFTFYMAQDTFASVAMISSAILFAQTLTVTALVVSIASILYFGMTIVGYGVMLITSIKKAMKPALRFEAIHDRDLSVFLYLPTRVPKIIVNDLKSKITKAAEKITPNFNVKRVGPFCLAVLRMGGTRLALVQIREHLRNIEQSFRSTYQNFLQRRKPEIFRSVGIYSPEKIGLTNLLNEISSEVARTGMPEAESAVKQIIEKQKADNIYLLNSALGTVWTIELPPAQREEFQKMLFPVFFIEDLAITDLYDEVEDFKKRIIYGFDSLYELANESQRSLQETFAHPEKYHLVSFFEPVKGRLVFVGRTEQIEDDLHAFGSLFVCQAWSSYLDNLLSEINLSLTTLGRAPSLRKETIQKMKDGELSVLRKNLKSFLANERFVMKTIERSEEDRTLATNNLDALKKRLQPTGSLKISLLDAIFSVNIENLKNLPKRLKRLREVFKRLSREIRETEKLVTREYRRRKPAFLKRRRRMLTLLPFIMVLPAVLVLAYSQPGMRIATVPLLTATLLTQAAYWISYLRMWRSFHSPGRFPSQSFNHVQLFILALTEAVYKFIASGNILSPSEVTVKRGRSRSRAKRRVRKD